MIVSSVVNFFFQKQVWIIQFIKNGSDFLRFFSCYLKTIKHSVVVFNRVLHNKNLVVVVVCIHREQNSLQDENGTWQYFI